jgi:hypothetical protein
MRLAELDQRLAAAPPAPAGLVEQASGGVGNLGGSMTGGDLPAGFGVKAGDKVIQFRGAVGVGDDRSNVRAGVGIPF